MLEASRIAKDLWVGSAPPPGDYSAHFDTLVLCSSNYQPPATEFPGVRVCRYPFTDTEKPTKSDLDTAWRAAQSVADEISDGRRVLVTCNMGRNRSAFVAALALHIVTGVSGKVAGTHVRRHRVDPLGVRALSNDAFRRELRRIP